ncbi:DNA-binding domain-containing protein [Chachezhania antarctica]|uniref:HvfC/BufC N-terminal domain-containing protein n=1 Tax=Chachezhania antarctica TaxID=2340860 RepID=UPI000EB1089E|nr:DNA-binding domain-containing protein [Chachezhania antarctica]|tara:strand:- start:3570 stop:4310 length:741 start_codon:yes stop_codon:yes gene_type:complete
MGVSQASFSAALFDPAMAAPSGLVSGPEGRRFNVYRNNVVVSLTEALKTGFPVIARLLGDENIDGLARLYLRTHPPTTPVMQRFGDTFPDFLASLDQLDHLGYLPDVARLELALRRAYHAADAAAVDPAQLAEIPPEKLANVTVTLAPAVQILRSDWPIHAIWAYNTQPDAPTPQPGAQDVLVTRPGFDPVPDLLPAGGAAFFAALQGGAPIGTALEAIGTPDFDLTRALTLALQGGAFTAISLTE